MRKISVIMLFVLLAGLFAACGQPTPAPEPAPVVTEAPAPAPVVEPAPVATEAPAPVATEAPTVAARTDGLPANEWGPATIRHGWWGNDARAMMTLKVGGLFQAAYPEIKYKGEPNGGTADHFQIVNTQLAAKNGPDLIQLGGNWPDYKQYLVPINDYIGKQLLIGTPEQFDQTALLPATDADGKIYCVSLGTNTLVLAYNKTMIEAAGVALPKDNMTWDELLAYGKDLKAKLPKGVAPFVDNGTNQANYLSYYYRQQGTPLYTSDGGGKSYATLESAKKWLKLWADMRDQGLIPDAATTAAYGETGTNNSALVAGKAAIGLIWSNQIAAYQGAMKDSLAAITLPKGGEKSYAIQMSQCLGVNKDSKNIEAAMLFVNYFVTSPDAGAVLGTNRGVPASPVVRTAISGQATPADAAVYKIFNAVADRMIKQDPNLPNDIEFVNELQKIGQKVAFKYTSVDGGAAELQALIERLTKK